MDTSRANLDTATEATEAKASDESNDIELKLEIKVLRTKVRTGVRGGTCRSHQLSGPTNPT
jgi:hypothetical protein